MFLFLFFLCFFYFFVCFLFIFIFFVFGGGCCYCCCFSFLFVFLADVLSLLFPLPVREKLFFWDKARFGAASSFHVKQAIFRHTGLFTHKQQTNKEAVILIIMDNNCMTFTFRVSSRQAQRVFKLIFV